MKKKLLSQLENAKNNFILVLASTYLLSNEKSYPILDESSCKFGTYSINFKQIANMMRKKEDRDIACKEFINMGLRSLIRESFELIEDYSDNTNQKLVFQNQDWYQFARIIRSCLSCNSKFQFDEYDKLLLPITWKNRTIDMSLDNTHLQLSFFGYVEAWKLFNEMNLFVKNTLS